MYRAGAAVVSTINSEYYTSIKGESRDADFELSASYPVQIRMLLAVTLTSKIKTSQMDELSGLRRLEPSEQICYLTVLACY